MKVFADTAEWIHAGRSGFRVLLAALRAMLFLTGLSALAANHYILAGAAGSGTDWSDALGSLPATLVRGDTYYVAAGSYGALTLNTPASGSSYIYITKATAANHGTDTGWQASYGTAPAMFGPAVISTSYWVIDGQTRNADWTSGYGITISNPNGSVINVDSASPVSFVTVRYLDLEGPGWGNTAVTGDGFYSNYPGTSHDMTVQYCYTHNCWPEACCIKGDNYTIEYCFMDQNFSTSGTHGQDIADETCNNVIVRYNIIRDPQGTAVYTVIGWGQVVSNDFIYGNIIYDDAGLQPLVYTTPGVSAFVEIISSSQVNNMQVNNNTLYNVQWWPRIIQFVASGTRTAYNNVYYSCGQVNGSVNNWTMDYSWYYNTTHDTEPHEQDGAPGLFVNAGATNFHLTANTASGLALPAPQNVDMDGNTFGANGIWNRGAYQYSTGGGAVTTGTPTVAVAAPLANSTVSNGVTLSATASDYAGGAGIASVTFLVDGAAVGVMSSAPYSTTWSSEAAANGSHTVQAVALDIAGNQALSPSVNVTVQNAAAQAQAPAGTVNYYVRAGAAGTGADWNNALPDLPATLVRGANYFVAGGAYGAETLNTAASGTNYIFITKATAANHGTDTGWQASYGSTTGVFGHVTISTSYWVIDGQTRNADWRTGYGFQISNPSGRCAELTGNNPIAFVTLRYLDLKGPGWANTNLTGQGVYSDLPGTSHDITVHACYTHNVWPDPIVIHGNNYTVEYCFEDQNFSTPPHHGQAIADQGCNNVIARYNIFRDIEGTAVYTVIGYGQVVSNLDIYGNIFYDDAELQPLGYTTPGVSAFLEVISPSEVSNVRVDNNTLYNAQWWPRIIHYAATGSNRTAYNNLYCNCSPINGSVNNFTQDYSWYYNTTHDSEAHEQDGVSNILANAAAGNYHLLSDTSSGLALPAPLNVDMDGNTRGANGIWDRGAYQYVTGVLVTNTTPTVALTAPVANATVSKTVALSATASDYAGGAGIANVTFLVDGASAAVVSTAPYSTTWSSLTTPNGLHTIQAQAQDVAGNQALSSSVTVTLQNTPPTVSLTVPIANATVSNAVALSATATAGPGCASVSNVTFLVDGVSIAVIGTAPYATIWNSLTAANGLHTIQAQAQDVAGNQALSSSVTVTVQNAVAIVGAAGLVGYWSFDEGSGTTASDASGNGNTGTLLGDASWGGGVLGDALLLDGQSGYVQVPSLPSLEQTLTGVTVCAWVKFATNATYTAGQMQSVVRKVLSLTTNVSPYTAYDLVVQDFGGVFEARMAVTRASDSARGNSGWGKPHPYGPWYHLAGVYDGSLVHLYVNGIEETNTAFSGTLLQTGQPLCIGRYGANGEDVNGLIDEVRVYNRPLSAAEIQALHSNVKPAPPTGLQPVAQ